MKILLFFVIILINLNLVSAQRSSSEVAPLPAQITVTGDKVRFFFPCTDVDRFLEIHVSDLKFLPNLEKSLKQNHCKFSMHLDYELFYNITIYIKRIKLWSLQGLSSDKMIERLKIYFQQLINIKYFNLDKLNRMRQICENYGFELLYVALQEFLINISYQINENKVINF